MQWTGHVEHGCFRTSDLLSSFSFLAPASCANQADGRPDAEVAAEAPGASERKDAGQNAVPNMFLRVLWVLFFGSSS